MTLRDLKLRLRALIAPRRVERELDQELAFHLERETEKHVAEGMSRADARALARARFGSRTLAADECRDARGTAFVDALARDVLYAVRTYRRAPLVAFTIVGTVALGLGLAATVFSLVNPFLFRVDAVRNPGELFDVKRPRIQGTDTRVRLTLPEYDALRTETNVFSDVFAMLPDITSRIDGRIMEGTLVTGNFFQVLGVDAARGRMLTPADDERFAGRPVMVLSQAGWSRLFDSDPNVIGRSVLVNGFRYEIAGVMPKGFRGLAVLPPDYWAPLSLVGQFRRMHAGRENMLAIDVIGRLKPGFSRETALAGLAVWASGRTDAAAAGRPANVTLEPSLGTVPDAAEALMVFSPIFFAFGLILMIGCANVANLLLARAVSRQREIGIRLSLGASRRRIVRQLLTENLLLALASAACGFVISRGVLEATIYAVMTTMPPELAELVRGVAAPAADWRVAIFLVAGAVVSTLCFGLAPALQATRLDLVRTMRGEVTRDARPSRARNVLIGVQVTASALLLISAAVFLRGALRAATLDPGFRTADTLVVEIVNEPMRAAMVRAVTADPSVAAVAASWPDSMSEPRAAFAEATAAKAAFAEATAAKAAFAEATAAKAAFAEAKAAGAARLSVAYRLVSPEYFGVLDISVLRGRSFTQAESLAIAAVAIVSENTARRLWPNDEAVGQVLRLEPDPQARRLDEPLLASHIFTVVGVARDVAGFRLAGFTEAGVYLPIDPAIAKTALTVRVHGDPELARCGLLERLTTIDPSMGMVMTMRTLAGLETYLLKMAFWVTVVLGGLALLLTVSGLFSVLSYLVEQRTREIGVRMALGAMSRNVTRLVISQSVRPVGFGLVAGGVLAAGLAIVLMSTPAASAIGAIVHVFDPVAYAASLLCIVAACLLAAAIPALRAARIDPIATLRQE